MSDNIFNPKAKHQQDAEKRLESLALFDRIQKAEQDEIKKQQISQVFVDAAQALNKQPSHIEQLKLDFVKRIEEQDPNRRDRLALSFVTGKDPSTPNPISVANAVSDVTDFATKATDPILNTLMVLDKPRQDLTQAVIGEKFVSDWLEKKGFGPIPANLIAFPAEVLTDPVLWAFPLVKIGGKFTKTGRSLRAGHIGAEMLESVARRKAIKASRIAEEVPMWRHVLDSEAKLIKTQADKITKLDPTGKARVRKLFMEPNLWFPSSIRRQSLTPEGRAIQALYDSIAVGELNRLQSRLKRFDGMIRTTAKIESKSAKQMRREVFDTMENVAGLAPKVDEAIAYRLNTMWKKHPLETENTIKAGMEAGDQFRKEQWDQLQQLKQQMFDRSDPEELVKHVVQIHTGNGDIGGVASSRIASAVKRSLDPLYGRAEELSKRLAELHPRQLKLARIGMAGNRELLRLEQRAGIAIEGLDSATLNYVFHGITDAGRRAMQRMGENLGRQIKGNFPTTRLGITRRRKFTDLSVDEINNIAREKKWVGPGEEFFTGDIIKSFKNRIQMSAGGRATAYSSRAALWMFAAPSETGMKLASFINRAGLRKLDDEIVFDLGKAKRGQTAKIAGINVKLKEHGLDKLRIPDDIAADLIKHETTIESPGRFLQAYDSINTIYRSFLTANFPQYHARNLLGNVYNGAWLGDALNPKHWALATRTVWRAMRGHSLRPDEAKWWNEGLRMGVTGRGMTHEIRQMAADFESTRFASKIGHLNEVVHNPGFKVGQFLEDSARLAVFINQRSKGNSILGSLRHTNKFLFDYTMGLSGTEKSKFRRNTLFYTFMRFNIPLQMEQLINPTRLYKTVIPARGFGLLSIPFGGSGDSFQKRRAKEQEVDLNTARGIRQREDDTPAYLNRIDTFHFGDMAFNLGLPVSDVMGSSIGTGREPAGIGEFGRQSILGQLTPVPKFFLEAVMGKTFFRGLDTDSMTRADATGLLALKIFPDEVNEALGIREERVKGKPFKIRMDPRLNHLIKSLPTSRYERLIERLADPREPDAVKRFTNFGVALFLGNPANLSKAQEREAVNVYIRALRRLKTEGLVAGSSPNFFLTDAGKRGRNARELVRDFRKKTGKKKKGIFDLSIDADIVGKSIVKDLNLDLK